MAVTISRRVRSRARLSAVLLAVLAVTGAGLSAVVPAVAAPAPVAVRSRVVPLVSAKLRRPVPKVTGRGGSSGRPARPPRMLSEIVGDRTATSSTWRDAGGAITVREYATPHFYRPGGSSGWQPIVTSLSRVAGRAGWWRSGANSWRASFGPGGAEQVTSGGTVIGFTPQRVVRPLQAPSVSGSLARWAGLWPDADLSEYVSSQAVSEELVLTARGAAAALCITATTSSPR